MRLVLLTAASLLALAVPVRAQYSITATAVIVDPISDTDWNVGVRPGSSGLEVHGTLGTGAGGAVLGEVYVTSETGAVRRTTRWIGSGSGRLVERDAALNPKSPRGSGALLRLRSLLRRGGDGSVLVTKVLAANS